MDQKGKNNLKLNIDKKGLKQYWIWMRKGWEKINMGKKGVGNLKLDTDYKGLWTNDKYGLKGLQIIINMDD